MADTRAEGLGALSLQPCGPFNSSGSLAMPAAIFLASSFVMRFAAARLPGSRLEIDVSHGKVIGVADDV